MKTLTKISLYAMALSLGLNMQAQTQKVEEVKKSEPKKESVSKNWYENIKFGGYTQLRYSRLLETNDQLKSDSNDKSLGDNQGFFLRRARIKFSGDVSDRLFVYLQYDMAVANPASGSTSNQLMLGLRDCYADLAVNESKTSRFRFGLSKVIFGYDNMQSSGERLAFDRSDAINSGARDERDLGVTYMFTPSEIKERYHYLARAGLKTTGDYGMFAVSAYNGQGLGVAEANDNLHIAARATYPFKVGDKQIVETSLQAYKGKYDLISTTSAGDAFTQFNDERVAATLVVYPQPFGFQGEYNIGNGPSFDKGTSSIKESKLEGGYAQFMYRYADNKKVLTPYARYQYYKGGKKFEKDASYNNINETELGVEWQWKKFEITAAYTISDRNVYYKSVNNEQSGNRLRLQFQFNY